MKWSHYGNFGGASDAANCHFDGNKNVASLFGFRLYNVKANQGPTDLHVKRLLACRG